MSSLVHPAAVTYRQRNPALAITADKVLVAFIAPYAGTITGVRYVPDSAITGADTNTRTISVINKKANASGAAVPASLALVNAVNPAAFIEQALTLSATPADLVVAAGDVIVFSSVHAGTGIVDPGGLVEIDFKKDSA